MKLVTRTVCIRCGATNHRPTEAYAQAIGCWSCGRRLPVRAPDPTWLEWLGWTLVIAALAALLYWNW